jgi:ribonuclease VapC
MVIDTSALMAILMGEPDAERYAAALVAAPRLRMAAPTWLEAVVVATARRGPGGHAYLVELLQRLQVTVVAFDEVLADIAYAGWLRYGRGRHPAGLNFGDCIAYALARQLREPLLFKGEDFSRTDVLAAL